MRVQHNAAIWKGISLNTAMRALATAGLCAVLLISGCAGSLAKQLEQEPYGRFAAPSAKVADAPPAPDRPEAAPVVTPPTAAPTEPVEDAKVGPVAADDLAAAGLAVPPDQLRALQADSWRPGKTLPREVAIQAFLARSPAVGAAVQRYRASFTRYGQVRWLNDLVRQYDSFAEGLMTGATTPHVMPEKPAWPLEGAGRIESAIAEVDVALSRARLAKDVLTALADMEEAFQEAHFWSRATDVLGRDVRLAGQVKDTTEGLYKSGRGSVNHVLMAQIRLDNLQERQKTAKQREEAELLRLAAVLDLPAESLQGARLELEETAPDVPERDAIRDRAARNAPDVQTAQHMAERATLMVQLVERQLLPELSVGASFTRTGDVPKRPADVMYATRAPFLAELRLTRESAEEAAEQARRTVPAMADMQWVRLSNAVRHRRLYAGPQTKRAKEALETGLDAYRAGRVPFADVDDALSRVLEVELETQRFRADAFVASARLRALTGLEPK